MHKRSMLAGLVVVATLAGCQSPAPVTPPTRRPPQSAPPRSYAPPLPPAAVPQRPLTARPPAYAGPTWYPAGGRISKRWTTIVVHHSATAKGGARAFDRNHRDKGWEGLGYHFVIGNGTDTPDGFVETGVRWHQQKHGAHCKTPDNYYNDHGIGICLVGDFTRTRPTARQLESLTKLTRFLSQTCGIPASRVTTHGAVTHGTQCPGNFPIAQLRSAVARPALASSMR